MKNSLVCFTLNNETFGINSQELVGVAAQCPFTSHPDLPKNVCGIIQWGGKIFPVIDVSAFLELQKSVPDFKNSNSHTFLFSSDKITENDKENYFIQFAIAVPGNIWMSTQQDSEAKPIRVIKITDIAKTLALASENRSVAA